MRLFAAVAAAFLGLAASSSNSAAQDGAPPSSAGGAVAAGRAVFLGHGCAGCHTLAAAGADGRIGPSLDGNPKLDAALVVERVTYGSAPMPDFGGQLSKDEIDAVARYVTQVAAK